MLVCLRSHLSSSFFILRHLAEAAVAAAVVEEHLAGQPSSRSVWAAVVVEERLGSSRRRGASGQPSSSRSVWAAAVARRNGKRVHGEFPTNLEHDGREAREVPNESSRGVPNEQL
jgi:anti-sigma factor RsiW